MRKLEKNGEGCALRVSTNKIIKKIQSGYEERTGRGYVGAACSRDIKCCSFKPFPLNLIQWSLGL
jgi:hypothetical protein